MNGVRWSVGVSCAVLALSGLVALAQEGSRKEGSKSEQGKVMTLRGEIVDLSCYLSMCDEGRGPDHVACAKDCLAKGAPAGILTADGKVTLLIYKKGSLADVAGKTLEVKGKCFERGGLKALVADEVPGVKGREGSRTEGSPDDKAGAAACACKAGCGCGHCKGGGQKACACPR